MSNLELWNRVSKTDPAHVKPITGKQYSGNSPKPYYIVQRLTEEFGPCGTGWGYEIVDERFERFSDTDSLHIAKVRLWYERAPGQDKGRGWIEQMGQTKASYITSKGSLLIDEDAPKKSVTDALVKCASYLGFAGDIFSGRWDDSKYVAELKREFEKKEDDSLAQQLEASIEQAKQKKAGVMAAVLADLDLSAKVVAGLGRLAEQIKQEYHDENIAGAFKLYDEGLTADEKTYLWSLLPSPVRSAIKREGQIRSLKKETA